MEIQTLIKTLEAMGWHRLYCDSRAGIQKALLSLDGCGALSIRCPSISTTEPEATLAIAGRGLVAIQRRELTPKS